MIIFAIASAYRIILGGTSARVDESDSLGNPRALCSATYQLWKVVSVSSLLCRIWSPMSYICRFLKLHLKYRVCRDMKWRLRWGCVQGGERRSWERSGRLWEDALKDTGVTFRKQLRAHITQNTWKREWLKKTPEGGGSMVAEREKGAWPDPSCASHTCPQEAHLSWK